MVDYVPGSVATTARLTLGASVYGDLETGGDFDWYRVDLVAGQTYEFRLHGVGIDEVADPVIRLRNAAGNQIAFNDDAGSTRWDGANSQDPYLEFTAPTSGTYYVDVGALANNDTGRFLLTAATHRSDGMVFTPDEIAWQSTNNYWPWSNQPVARWDLGPGATLTVDTQGLSAESQFLARNALQAWSDVSGITFVEVTAGAANITFEDYHYIEDAGFIANEDHVNNGNRIVTSDVTISQAVIDLHGTGFESYSFQIYIHEIGHALGLGHGGNYNADDSDFVPTFGVDNYYLNDAQAYSIMSYMNPNSDRIVQQETINTFVNADFYSMLTPAMADVIAIRNLYPERQTSTRIGNNSYGFYSNTGNAALDAAAGIGADMFMNIVDDGGYDILNFSQTNANQTINLTPETFSNVLGGVSNLSIARGTVIEEAYGGSGTDLIYGNEVANWITGNDGNDQLFGFGDRDSIYGGQGEDIVKGGGGNDFLDGGTGADRIDGEDGDDILRGKDGYDTLNGGPGNDDLRGGEAADRLFGDGGIDTASYGDSPFAVDVRLGLNGAVGYGSNGYANGDSLTGIENLTGSNHGDFLQGNEAANVLDGGTGDDLLVGLQGADTLRGGNGADFAHYLASRAGVTVNFVTGRGAGGDAQGDTYESVESVYGSNHDDIFVLDAAANTIYGKDRYVDPGESDTVSYRHSNAGVSVNLSTNFASGGYAQGDELYGIDNVVGSAYGDFLVGREDINVLDGGAGNDTLQGRQGADVLRGGNGDDDTASYLDSETGVTVNLVTGRGAGGDAQGDTYESIENVFGSYGNDTFVLDAAANSILWDPSLLEDIDTADYRYSNAAVRVDLATNVNAGGYAQGDDLSGVDNVIGSAYGDTLSGTDTNNTLNGGGGTDILKGLRGNDRYYVDDAGDRVFEAAGGGSDRVLASVDYAQGAGQEIELIATADAAGTAAISLTGNAFGQQLVGNAGANRLDGKAGADVMTGYGGLDRFVFSTTPGAGNVDRITDFSHADDTIVLARSVFAALPAGTLSSAAFKDLADPGAQLDGSDRILYDHDTGALSYDADGSGTVHAAIRFATLVNTPLDLSFNDFLVV